MYKEAYRSIIYVFYELLFALITVGVRVVKKR